MRMILPGSALNVFMMLMFSAKKWHRIAEHMKQQHNRELSSCMGARHLHTGFICSSAMYLFFILFFADWFSFLFICTIWHASPSYFPIPVFALALSFSSVLIGGERMRLTHTRIKVGSCCLEEDNTLTLAPAILNVYGYFIKIICELTQWFTSSLFSSIGRLTIPERLHPEFSLTSRADFFFSVFQETHFSRNLWIPSKACFCLPCLRAYSF